VRIGRYELEGEIARGGMGAVFRARSPAGDPVALKVLLPDPRGDATRTKRFLREGELVARLRHPAIVAVRDVGEDRGHLFLAMDLIEGESLQRRIGRDGPLAPAEAVRIARAVAEALEHAHRAGILHRDVKPANVLLGPDGAVFLTDFGLARDVDASLSQEQLSRTGHFLGTPGYWPPEQASGDKDRIGPRSDVYALGATLWATLIGRPPFEGETLLEVVDATENQAAQPPGALRAGVGRALDRVVLRALAKDPADRYPSAAAFAEALRTLDPGRSRRVRPGRAALWVGVAAVAAAVLGGTAWRVTRAAAARRAADDAAGALDAAAWLQRARAARQAGRTEAALAAYGEALARDAGLDGARHERARLRVAAGRDPEALADLDRLIARDPDRAEALLLRGRIRYRLGAAAGALLDLTRAIALAPDDLGARLTRANVLVDTGEAEAGLAEVERVLEATPHDPRALALRGRARFDVARAGEPTDREVLSAAVADLERAVELDPGYAAAWAILGRVRRFLAQPREAVSCYSRALGLDDANVSAWDGRARARLLLGDAEGARGDAARAVALAATPAHAVAARRVLARACDALGDLESARDALDSAVELLPDAETYAQRAVLRARQGDAEGARADLDRSIEIDGEHAGARFERGVANARAERWEEAIADFDALLAVAPDDVDGRMQRAGARLQTGDYEGSRADYDRVLEQVDDPRAYRLRSWVREQLGDLEGAEDDLDQAIVLTPRDVRVWQSRALLRRQRGDLDGALADYTQALYLEPESAELWYGRGLVFQAREEHRQADGDFTQAIALDAQPRYYRGRGVSRQKGGRAAEALADLDRAVEGDPEDAHAVFWRAQARSDLKQPDRAADDLERYLELDPSGLDDDTIRELIGHLRDYAQSLADLEEKQRALEEAEEADPEPPPD